MSTIWGEQIGLEFCKDKVGMWKTGADLQSVAKKGEYEQNIVQKN